MAAAFMVVPGLLFLFHRLSRPPAGGPTSLPPTALPTAARPDTAVPPTARPPDGGPAAPFPLASGLHPSAGSVADEAERWLRSQA